MAAPEAEAVPDPDDSEPEDSDDDPELLEALSSGLTTVGFTVEVELDSPPSPPSPLHPATSNAAAATIPMPVLRTLRSHSSDLTPGGAPGTRG
ncbi:hypothetical protein GCM10022199_16880 [Marihabitans asiaticum]